MAMTFAQLTAAFETYTNVSDQVDAAQLALWFNEAQLDLAYELGAVETRQLELTPGALLRPEADWLRVVGCELDYKRQPDGSLLFPNGGSGRLFYRRQPRPFSGIDSDQVSELPEALHYLPALFAASRYWDMESEGDGEESGHAAKWLSYNCRVSTAPSS